MTEIRVTPPLDGVTLEPHPTTSAQAPATMPPVPYTEMFVVAFGVHLVLFAVAAIAQHWTADRILQTKDAWSYALVAKAIAGQLRLDQVSAFDRRVFIGYPLLVGVVARVGFPVLVAALGLNWIAAAFSAPLIAKITGEENMGWAMAVLFPSYLIHSTLVMSESTLLWFTLWGLWRVRQRRLATAGGLLGYAGLIRPMACFAVLGLLAEGLAGRRWRMTLRVALIALAVVIVGEGLRQLWGHDAVGHLSAYANDPRAFGGQPLTWPFAAILETPRLQHVAWWKIAYVWAHVAITLLGCALLVRQRAVGMAVWLIANTLFALSIGLPWGFQDFHRFILPALPPLLYAFRLWYPKSRRGWVALGLCASVVALYGLLHSGSGPMANVKFPGPV